MPRRSHLLLALAAAAVLAAFAVHWYASRDPLPREIRIAAGRQYGLYHAFATDFATRLHDRTGRPVRVLETSGTEENIGLLRDGGAELALIQTVSLRPDGVAGIAPLFLEPFHFLARKGKGVRSLADLAGRRVSLGPDGSGTRQNAYTLLAHYEVPPESLRDTEEFFGVLATDTDYDAALVATGWENPTLEKLLHRADLELIGLPDADALAARHPWFTAVTIPRGLFPGKPPVPPEPVRTVAVTGLLVGRDDVSRRLVGETLAALYETDLRATFPDVLTAKAAQRYDAAVMHPAVADYHDPSAGLNRLAGALEFLSKSKEAVLGVIALGLLLWGWVRRRRERAAAASDRLQKDELDRFIGETLAVELEQMEVTDPEALRPFLRRVTRIKQAALRELTSEKVRGDQLFAIFLSQCAALSEKIQMRMMYGKMPDAKA